MPVNRRGPQQGEESGRIEDLAARESVLQQVRELTEDYQQLVQSVVRSEKRFRGLA